jgi:hypothetical protein
VARRRPRLEALVARTFHGRTESALDFLQENVVPITVIEVALYEDNQQRRFLDITGEHEPELPPRPPDEIDITRIDGRRVRLSDLIEAELLNYGDDLVWHRPRLGTTYRAKISDAGGSCLKTDVSSPPRQLPRPRRPVSRPAMAGMPGRLSSAAVKR